MSILGSIRKVFQRKEVIPVGTKIVKAVTSAAPDLSALIQPGSKVILPAAVPAPAPPIIEQAAPVVENITPAPIPYCLTCGQALPPKSVVGQTGMRPVAIHAQIIVDPDAERTDLPPRTQPQIAALIAGGETPEARVVRILNDKMRYAHQQGR
jgi:hypothetical protein